MGGMHTWLWGETYPGFMDALMPLASLPAQIAGRNRMMRRMVIDSIREDPEWRGGEYDRQPRGLTAAVYTLLFMTSSPRQWQKAAPTREAADRFFDEQVRARQLPGHHAHRYHLAARPEQSSVSACVCASVGEVPAHQQVVQRQADQRIGQPPAG